MSRRGRWAAHHVGQVIRTFEHAHGRSPGDLELAAALGVFLETYRSDDIEPHSTTLADTDHLSPSNVAERNRLPAILRDGLCRIPTRDARLRTLYYVEKLSHTEIGRTLGMSESRVCKLLARASVGLRAEAWESRAEQRRAADPAYAIDLADALASDMVELRMKPPGR